MFDRRDDTIIAISSPPGVATRGILRLSGRGALDIASSAFHASGTPPLSEVAGQTVCHGEVRIDPDDAATSVPAKAFVFRGPRSYTREDVVELHVPGAAPVTASLLDQCMEAGARQAEPGEFTARAYFAGTLDLARVEGVAAVIHARSDAQLRASEALLQGRLSRKTHAMREELADLLALLEAEIDFVEEPIDFIAPDRVISVVNRVSRRLEEMIRHTPSVEKLEALPEVFLVGLPNAGKSTLLNRLTGVNRAIASAMAGTTRDVIRAPVTLASGEILLCDTAGVESTDESEYEDTTIRTPEREAQSQTRRGLARADLILVLLDATKDPGQALEQLLPTLPNCPRLILLNKIDRLPPPVHTLLNDSHKQEQVLAISALTGAGIEHLRRTLDASLLSEIESHGADHIALSRRQRDSLAEARSALERAASVASEVSELAQVVELVAMDVRAAMNALSLLTGEITTEDLLGKIFANFCIGK